MQLGALGLVIGMILLFPAVPWVVFPGHRRTGAVAALVATGACGVWVLNAYGTPGIGFLGFLVPSCVIRVLAELVGAFEQGRDVRAHRDTCPDSASCGVDHQTDGGTYPLVAFLSITISLALYFTWG
ncbi:MULTISPECIES: hypothetical protein [Streptomyces]|uniref:Uncharacterized protein n=1 Tax=Streptomyces alboflavus TaxID=67267 RepID=A0A1Z1WDB3_9ACTN|nr:hypothetical protein [Streptomyces alboflavus]ARX84340.1 hypothetical protein SMD44_03778 [Streptomyces alboflavus]